MNTTINTSRKRNMKRIYILLVIMLLCQQTQAATNEFVMKPTSFTVAGGGGKYFFDLSCDRYLKRFRATPDIVEMNVKGFEFISYEDSGGQVDSIRCLFPVPVLLEGSFIIFKPNETSSTISGTITIHHYTLFRGKPQEERTLVATYTQQPGVVPSPSLEIINGSVENSFIDETGTKKNQTITYYDAFRRPTQTIHVGASPSGKDMVSFIEYDNMGRSDAKTYLEYPIANLTPGSKRSNPLIEQRDYYVSLYGPDGRYAYSEKEYEAGNIVSAAGGIGATQRIHSGFHTVFEHRLNTTSDNIKKFSIVNDSVLICQGIYSDNTLQVKRAQSFSPEDETSSMTVDLFEYYDSEQKMIAKEERLSPTDRRISYYVYDEKGLQRYIIPPIESERLQTGSYTPHSLNTYCYYFEYDEYGRIVKQYVPGMDYILKLYDNRGRIAMSQDGNQRVNNQWSFTKYDIYDRPVLSGVYTGGTYDSHKAALKSQNIMYEQRGNIVHGYTNDTYPSVANESDYLSITYYDDYDWLPLLRPFLSGVDYYEFSAEDALGEERSSAIRGNITGAKAKLLGDNSEKWHTTVNYYNDKGEIIQTFKEIYGVGAGAGAEIASNKYDFTGKVIQAKVRQVIKASRMESVEYEYNKWLSYDDQGRLLKIEQQVTGDTTNGKVVLAEYSYDDLGRVSTKSIHNGTDVNKFEYTIADQNYYSESDSFTYRLSYYDNGNVDRLTWFAGKDSTQGYGYDYTYDRQGQLSDAVLLQPNQISDGSTAIPTWTVSEKYSEKGMTYDANGNLLTLRRSNGTGGSMHDIVYEYDGNQLTSVRMNAGGTIVTGYQYDRNGNMIYDPVNGVHIEYNSLNLPQRIFDGTNEISYIYTSTGEKVGKRAGSSFTYYRGVMVYPSNTTLLYMQHPEGTVSMASDGYTYNYFKTDHTGSTRVLLSAVNGSLQQQQTTDYYPFGLAWEYNNLNKNKYLFSGKELQDDDIGISGLLGLYDFGARYYNPVLGRWFNVDPKLQGFNPYVYCGNDPILFQDANGQAFGGVLLTLGNLIKAACVGAFINANMYTFSVMLSGDLNNWNWEALKKSMLSGGLSTLASIGIGQFVGPSGNFWVELTRGVLHGSVSGGISELVGEDFIQGFASGALSSLTSSGIAKTSLGGKKLGQYIAGGLSGGIGALITGGDFWKGVATGLITVAFNHSIHANFVGDIDLARKKMAQYTSEENKEVAAVKTHKSYLFGLRKVEGAVIEYNPKNNVSESHVNWYEKDGKLYVRDRYNIEYPVDGHMHTHTDQSDINEVTDADRSLQSVFGSKPIEILYRGHVYYLYNSGGYVKTNITY